MKNLKNLIIPIGLLFMATSSLLDHLPKSDVVDFFSGFCLGLAIVCFLVGIILISSDFGKKN